MDLDISLKCIYVYSQASSPGQNELLLLLLSECIISFFGHFTSQMDKGILTLFKSLPVRFRISVISDWAFTPDFFYIVNINIFIRPGLFNYLKSPSSFEFSFSLFFYSFSSQIYLVCADKLLNWLRD